MCRAVLYPNAQIFSTAGGKNVILLLPDKLVTIYLLCGIKRGLITENPNRRIYEAYSGAERRW